MFLSAVILAIISSYEFFMITVFTISAACSHTSIQFSMQAYMFFHTTTVRRSLSPYSLCIFSTYRREQDTECRRAATCALEKLVGMPNAHAPIAHITIAVIAAHRAIIAESVSPPKFTMFLIVMAHNLLCKI